MHAERAERQEDNCYSQETIKKELVGVRQRVESSCCIPILPDKKEARTSMGTPRNSRFPEKEAMVVKQVVCTRNRSVIVSNREAKAEQKLGTAATIELLKS